MQRAAGRLVRRTGPAAEMLDDQREGLLEVTLAGRSRPRLGADELGQVARACVRHVIEVQLQHALLIEPDVAGQAVPVVDARVYDRAIATPAQRLTTGQHEPQPAACRIAGLPQERTDAAVGCRGQAAHRDRDRRAREVGEDPLPVLPRIDEAQVAPAQRADDRWPVRGPLDLDAEERRVAGFGRRGRGCYAVLVRWGRIEPLTGVGIDHAQRLA